LSEQEYLKVPSRRTHFKAYTSVLALFASKPASVYGCLRACRFTVHFTVLCNIWWASFGSVWSWWWYV